EQTAASHCGRTSSSASLAARKRRGPTAFQLARTTWSACTTLRRLHGSARSRPWSATTTTRARPTAQITKSYRFQRQAEEEEEP
ncbi:hypothetical protein IWW47_001622, partial [Coemansia sp. RSA 2052]